MNFEMKMTIEQARILRLHLDGNEDSVITNISNELTEQINRCWDSNRNQQDKCNCGHSYERHFDSYDDMRPIGCKYCECFTFTVDGKFQTG